MSRHQKTENNRVQDAEKSDAQLSQLLRAWTGIEPKDDFDAEVWRRIKMSRHASRTPAVPQPVVGTFRPLRLAAAAVVVGFLLGGGLGWLSSPQTQVADTDEALYYSQNLSNSYTSLVKGDR